MTQPEPIRTPVPPCLVISLLMAVVAVETAIYLGELERNEGRARMTLRRVEEEAIAARAITIAMMMGAR